MKFADGQPQKFSILIGLCAILASITAIVSSPPAKGYEISLYEVYPLYFWTGLILSILIGQLLILHRGVIGRETGYWKFGVVLMIVPELIVVYLPIMREYTIFGRADPLTHIGYMKDIVGTGLFGSRLIYPAIHDIGVTIAYSTGLPLREMINIVPPIISLIYFVSIYLMIKEAFGDKMYFILPFGLLLVFTVGHILFTPYLQSTLLLPFVLFLYFKYRETRDTKIFAGLVISVSAIVLFHPLTSMYLIWFFILAVILGILYRSGVQTINITLIAIVAYTIWYFGFSGILRMMSITAYNIAYGAGESSLERYGGIVSTFSPRITDLIQVAVFTHGILILVSLMAGMLLIWLAIRYYRTDELPAFDDQLVLGSFLMFGSVALTFLFFDVIGGYGRPLLYARFFGLLATGLFVYELYNRFSPRRMRVDLTSVIVVILVILVILSVFGAYRSPLTKRHNHQTTEMDIVGGEWIFEHRDAEESIDAVGIYYYRLYDMTYGASEPETNIDDSIFETRPPDHFGYENQDSLGEVYANGTSYYLIVTELGRRTYPAIYPNYRQYWRFTPSDFTKLEQDSSVQHIYTNGEFDTYAIRGLNSTLRS